MAYHCGGDSTPRVGREAWHGRSVAREFMRHAAQRTRGALPLRCDQRGRSRRLCASRARRGRGCSAQLSTLGGVPEEGAADICGWPGVARLGATVPPASTQPPHDAPCGTKTRRNTSPGACRELGERSMLIHSSVSSWQAAAPSKSEWSARHVMDTIISFPSSETSSELISRFTRWVATSRLSGTRVHAAVAVSTRYTIVVTVESTFVARSMWRKMASP